VNNAVPRHAQLPVRKRRTTRAGQDGNVDDDLQLARRAASAGAAVGQRYFAALAGLPRELKADGSVVTAADRAVEAAIREVVEAARPGDAILGEEGGQTGGGTGGRRWIIDPIDGTALFVAGDDRWLVLIALEEAGEIVAAVAAVPAQDRTWWARRGAGAYEAAYGEPERRIAVAVGRTDDLAASRLAVLDIEPKMAEPLLAVVPGLPWDVHPALMVARGDLDLALQTNGQVWDFAATSLIVEEAGGSYRGLDGRRSPSAGPSLYARSDALGAAALDVLGRQRTLDDRQDTA
jgi:histidinol-phosphatase